MEMLEDEEYGRIVVIKRDGSYGGRFPLYEDTLIGRYVALQAVRARPLLCDG